MPIISSIVIAETQTKDNGIGDPIDSIVCANFHTIESNRFEHWAFVNCAIRI